MESQQPVILSNPSVAHGHTNQKSGFTAENSSDVNVDSKQKEIMAGNPKQSVGVIDVCIHQARDIHNICIYHKQDVYAKLSLTDDPEKTLSTQIINGGGKNPVFNEKFRLHVRTIDSSLKCEIWMLSRVRNYLQDQLLGFTLVPLSDVLLEIGKPEREFSLTSSDLFHSPAGFVQLTFSYSGAMPEVLEIHTRRHSSDTNVVEDISEPPDSEPCKLDKIEFPDPCIVKENEMMLSEYFGIPCTDLESRHSEETDITNNDNHLHSDIGVCIVESFTKGHGDTNVALKIDAPLKIETSPWNVSTNQSPSSLTPTVSQSISDPPEAFKSPDLDIVSPLKENTEDVKNMENGSSKEPASTFPQPVIIVNVEPEPKVVQQEIVDMYMKSMQQFTEALAKMKLPLDIENASGIKIYSPDLGSSTSEEKVQSSKSKGDGPSPRVFYGSRAFF